MDRIDLLIIVFMLVGYLIFSLIDVLADKFIFKVKTVRLTLYVEDYKELKKYLKESGSPRKVDEWLQFHFKEDVKEYLEELSR